MDTSETDLFFQATVDRYLTSRFFVSRDWLVKEVELLLADPNCRFVVLTAEPGAGKSAFAAQFVHEHSADETLVYFIRRDQVARLDDVSAIRFFLRIGLQLRSARSCSTAINCRSTLNSKSEGCPKDRRLLELNSREFGLIPSIVR
jgi:hypothetical protein